MISFCKNLCIIYKKKRKRRSYSKVCNAERIVKIFRLEAKLQLSVYNKVGTLKQIFLWYLRSI